MADWPCDAHPCVDEPAGSDASIKRHHRASTGGETLNWKATTTRRGTGLGATPAGAADLNSDTHGFVGVEQRPDPVVGEPSETEGAAFDASGEVVDCLGGPVGDPGLVPVGDLVIPTTQGAAQPGQLRWTVSVGEVLNKFT